ncbi:MAG: hypothetical protein SFV15_04745 [Polyangiaceae bacterium]|nr:hypothetical protein [Polyangiaceae bacterium]
MKWSTLFGSCLLLLSVGCVEPRTELPTSGLGAPYVLLFPELLRDPKDDVRDLMLGALRDLDHDLGGGVLEVRTDSNPMHCWEGQRSIPRVLCHSEAQSRMLSNGEDGLIWGYAVNARAKVFLLFLSARSGATPVQLEPSGKDGQLTRRDLLSWFREAVLASLGRSGDGLEKARALRDRLLAQSEAIASRMAPSATGASERLPVSAKDALWAAELAHLAGDISWSLASQNGGPRELQQARDAYAAATGFYPKKKDAAWLNAEVGLAMSELRLGDQQKNADLLLSAVRHFSAARARFPGSAPVAEIELGRGQALLLAGELKRDPKQLWDAVSVLEASMAATQKVTVASHSAKELVCRAALGAATLDVTYSTRGREACERALGALATETGNCKPALAAKGKADLGQLLFLEAEAKVDFDLLERVPPRLECARTFPAFSTSRRTTLTYMLAQAEQQLGIQMRDVARLKQAAALYRSLLVPTQASIKPKEEVPELRSPEPHGLHRELGLTLAFLGRLEPTVLTLTEAVAELQLVSPSALPKPLPLLQAQVRAQLQLAVLLGTKEPMPELRANLLALSKELTFGKEPLLWLDNALLSTFLTWQVPQGSARELQEAGELAQLSADRASLLFPEQAEAFRVLSLMLRLKEASTLRNNQQLCGRLQAADAFLSSPSPSLPTPSPWPNPTRLDLSRLLAELRSDAQLTRSCQKVRIP